MRQAGRYMAEYRALRTRYSLLDICRTPDLATEVTLQPVRRIEVDAAILFSDLLLPLEPMGIRLDPVPTFELSPRGRPLRCLVRLAEAKLPPPDGYQTHSERAGLFVMVQDLAGVDQALIERLHRAAPAGVRSGTCYLRVHDRPSLPVELVLPLEASD